jgi:tetratricopeptide (TPR) repeat protein
MPRRPSDAFVGRERELEQLEQRLGRAAEGHGSLVLVGGEAGIGKTTLVAELTTLARELGMLTFIGYSYDLATTPPYGPWRELLLGYEPTGTLPPPPAALLNAHGITNESELAAAALTFLEELSAQAPVLLVLEDLHWADQASLELLAAVARHVQRLAALVVITYRDAELTPQQPLYFALPRLVRETRAERIELRPLSDEAIRALLHGRYRLDESDEARLAHYLERYAEGNPFFTDEVLRTLEHERLLDAVDGQWILHDLSGVQVPPLVRQIIEGQLSWQPEPFRTLLQIAAVIGEEAPLDVWQAVAAVDDDELAEVVSHALSARLLEETPDRSALRFRHALIRETLYESTILPRRRAWHRAVGEFLAARPDPDPDIVAHHFTHADDPRAAEWLLRAAERAARAFALPAAGERYERALAYLDTRAQLQTERGWLLCEIAEAYRFTDPRRALRYLDAAMSIAEATDDALLLATTRWIRARVRAFFGENAMEEMELAVATLESLNAEQLDSVRGARRRFGFRRGVLATWLARHGAYAKAEHYAYGQLEQAAEESAGGRGIEDAYAWHALGLCHAGQGRPQEARSAFARARNYFAQMGDHHSAGISMNWELMEVVLPYYADSPAERRQLRVSAEAAWQRSGHLGPAEQRANQLTVFSVLLLEGEWERLERAATSDLAADAARVDALRVLAELAYNRGQPDEAWSHIRAAIPEGPAIKPSIFYFHSVLRLQRLAVELALDDGDPALARQWLDSHAHWLTWSGRVLDLPEQARLTARYEAAG